MNELREIQAAREEKDKRPKTAEIPKRQLKKDSRLIPGIVADTFTN